MENCCIFARNINTYNKKENLVWTNLAMPLVW